MPASTRTGRGGMLPLRPGGVKPEILSVAAFITSRESWTPTIPHGSWPRPYACRLAGASAGLLRNGIGFNSTFLIDWR